MVVIRRKQDSKIHRDTPASILLAGWCVAFLVLAEAIDRADFAAGVLGEPPMADAAGLHGIAGQIFTLTLRHSSPIFPWLAKSLAFL